MCQFQIYCSRIYLMFENKSKDPFVNSLLCMDHPEDTLPEAPPQISLRASYSLYRESYIEAMLLLPQLYQSHLSRPSPSLLPPYCTKLTIWSGVSNNISSKMPFNEKSRPNVHSTKRLSSKRLPTKHPFDQNIPTACVLVRYSLDSDKLAFSYHTRERE